MESQPQNPEFRINPENFHPCTLNLVAAVLPLILVCNSSTTLRIMFCYVICVMFCSIVHVLKNIVNRRITTTITGTNVKTFSTTALILASTVSVKLLIFHTRKTYVITASYFAPPPPHHHPRI